LAERALPSLVRIHNEAQLFKPAHRYLMGILDGLTGILNPHPYWEWPYRVVAFPFYLLFGAFDLSSTRGSGFYVADELVLTNAHVVENASRLLCQLTDGRTAEATLEALDADLDLALLRIAHGTRGGLQGDPPPVLPLRRYASRLGEPVLAAGFPSREPLRDPFLPASEIDPELLLPKPRVTIGVVSALDVELGNARTRYVETDAALNPGSSGGPILGLDGSVLGIATFIGVGKENEGYAVPVESVLAAFGELLAPQEEPGGVRTEDEGGRDR
jgi:S1-C subfamily serine protease